jgi:hypothetical protein
MASTEAKALEPGAAAFYGVRPPWLHLWEQVLREGRAWWYLDNAWFDVSRESYFRVGVNAVQSWSTRPSDGKRLAQLGVKVRPWRRSGRHVLVCPQSDEFMQTVAGQIGWQQRVTAEIAAHTGRLTVVRGKRAPQPLAVDMADAWLVVVHSSAAAVEALIHGIPVIVTDPNCAAAEFSSTFDEIDWPRRPNGVEEWAARLADSQWSLQEMRAGMAWRAMCGMDG